MEFIKSVRVREDDPDFPDIPNTPPLPDVPNTPPLPDPPDTPKPGSDDD